MINIYKFFFTIIFFVYSTFVISVTIWGQVLYYVDEVVIKGNYKTDKNWLKEFIGYKFPASLSVNDLDYIRTKLLSTEVYYHVEIILEHKVTSIPATYKLIIVLHEKWTIIPVVRGGLGGESYYRVIGIYDTHMLGKLWTLGIQTFKYENSPDGWVVWAKAPRWLDGNNVLGTELWNNYKQRIIYNSSDIKSYLKINSHWKEFRIFYLYPLLWPYKNIKTTIQTGIDLRLKEEYPHRYTLHNGGASHLLNNFNLKETTNRQVFVGIASIYDNIIVKSLNYNGTKAQFNAGPVFDNKETFYKFEFELFKYQHYSEYNLNFAGHLFVANTNFKGVENQYYLGGLDSIRGIYDGFLCGTKAYYLNLELKKIFLNFKYIHLLGVVFIDLGGANYNWEDVMSSTIYTSGIGIRINFPKVYRLMFRIDYGWSLIKPYQKGFSLGMNDLFQPYKPL